MIICNNIKQLRAQVVQWRNDNGSIAFVPTMGNLHDGHLSLVKIAKQKASRVVASIYVNPLQFAPDEDFFSYPRTLDSDLEKLETLGTDLVFIPDSAMIYPQGEQHSTFVEVPKLSHIIEGEFRPVFFRGIATVVLKFFNLVKPDIAVFGEKDFQQLLIIRRMVADMCLPIEIIGGETQRETNGLAMSSRNNYLEGEERNKSRLFSQALLGLRQQVRPGVNINGARTACIEGLREQGFLVDYVTLREASDLQPVPDDEVVVNKELIILAAVTLGRTRLIDNIKFTV